LINFSKYRALSFDCYGTLIDWERGIEELASRWSAALDPRSSKGRLLTTFAAHQARFQQVRPALTYSEVLRRTWREIEREFGLQPDLSHANSFANSVGTWPPFPDTVKSLRYFQRFYRLAILSNVDNHLLNKTLKLLQVPFSLTVTSQDAGAYKPSSIVFERAIALLGDMGISKNEILHVAQSKHHDISPGRALGLTTVWVDRHFGQKGSGAAIAADAEPHLVVKSLEELVSVHNEQIK
jgi:2-haloacid dehalogenase